MLECNGELFLWKNGSVSLNIWWILNIMRVLWRDKKRTPYEALLLLPLPGNVRLKLFKLCIFLPRRGYW